MTLRARRWKAEWIGLCLCLAVLGLAGRAMADIGYGLVAYYPFNGSAVDATGNGHDGTVFGASRCEDRFGQSRSAYCFDGIDQFIDIGPYLGSNARFSVAAWVRLRQAGDERVILSSYRALPDSRLGYELKIQPSGKAAILFAAGSGSLSTTVESSRKIMPNRWYHVAAVQGGGRCTLYINGHQEGSGTVNLYPTDFNTVIGARPSTTPPFSYFKGSLDEIRLYDRELTLEEVRVLYRSGGAVTDLSHVFVQGGGEGVISVQTATKSGEWIADTSAAWILIRGGKSGKGAGKVTYVVLPNATGSPRRGEIHVGGQAFGIYQEK